MKTRLSIAILAVAVQVSAAMAQEPSGIVRVNVRIEGTQTPIQGVQLTLSPRKECGDCTVDLPDKEEDLLAYLKELAAARGLVGDVKILIDGNPGSMTVPVTPSAVTDENGNAVFRDVKPGQFAVSSRRTGYVAASSVPVALDREHLSPQVLLSLIPTGSISGHIRDAKGTPVANAVVAAGTFRYEAGGRVFGFTASTRTDISGSYLLNSVAPGDYSLRVQPVASPAAIIYYPGTSDVEKAVLLRVDGGQDVVGVDFNLP